MDELSKTKSLACLIVPERATFVTHVASLFGIPSQIVQKRTTGGASLLEIFKKQHHDGYTNIPFLVEKVEDLENTGHKHVDISIRAYFSYMLSKYPTNAAYNSFALDGTSCCGKSTLLSKYSSYKVNDLLRQDIKTYNFDPVCSLSYLICSQSLAQTCQSVIFDRSCLANVAYQYAYYVMTYIKQINGRIEPEPYFTTTTTTTTTSTNRKNATSSFTTARLVTGESAFAICETYTRVHNLSALLECINGARLNIVFLIDSCIESVMSRMEKRGDVQQSDSDLAKSACRLYIIAQNVAFAYLAHKCRLPCIDLSFVRTLCFLDHDDKSTTTTTTTTGQDQMWSQLEAFLDMYVDVGRNPSILKQNESNNVIRLSESFIPFSSNLEDYTKLQLLKRVFSNR